MVRSAVDLRALDLDWRPQTQCITGLKLIRSRSQVQMQDGLMAIPSEV